MRRYGRYVPKEITQWRLDTILLLNLPENWMKLRKNWSLGEGVAAGDPPPQIRHCNLPTL